MLQALLRTWAKESDHKYNSWLEALSIKGIDDLDDLKAKFCDPQVWQALMDSLPNDPEDVLSTLKGYLVWWRMQEESRKKRRLEAPSLEEDPAGGKRLKISHDTMIRSEQLSNCLKALAMIEQKEGFLQSNIGFPYPADLKLRVLFLRPCYPDVFDQLVKHVSQKEKLAISGTPGIGKSLFFIYVLWRFLREDSSWRPKVIVYQHQTEYLLIEIEKQEASELFGSYALQVIKQCDFYVVDGMSAHPIHTPAPTLFIASPPTDSYGDYVKQNKALQFCFPIWTIDELEKCRTVCYPEVSKKALESRYEIYGGIARTIFGQFILEPNQLVSMIQMEGALSNFEAVKGIRVVREPTAIHKESHTLIHCNAGYQDGIPYQFLYATLASKYVGRELWRRYHKEMATKLQEFLGGSDSELSRRLFEIYMHLTLQNGNVSLRCRNLKTGEEEPNFELIQALKESKRSKSSELPIKFEEGVYYEGCDNLPSMDAVIPGVGIMQATVGENHPIKGVQTLERVCTIFKKNFKHTQAPNPRTKKKKAQKKIEETVKFYFVVPPHRFPSFKLQPIQTANGASPLSVPQIEQYVLELDFGISKPSNQV
jgi:hypothetical protein